MTNGEANALRLCLNCGNPGARLLRLSDGRAVRVCDECLRGPSRAWLNGSTERDPIGREVEYVVTVTP